ncbi:MAG: 23S rRNA (guanosine(2251)-2'-O)-methyltransferase RlmB [Defluviitaleaceae bacterium]|nr:23S rRNA (guanosine(2251)-2'-O)-methyltransferase RlmB [Defluviitaleaceae bacterium]
MEKFNEDKDFLIYGRKAVLEIINSEGAIDKLFVKKGDKEGTLRVILAKAREAGIVITEVPREKLDAMADNGNHQGVIAQTPAHQYADIDAILAAAHAKNEPPFILICDKIFDPHNLGAMIRTAEACGVHGVIIPKRRSCGITPGVIRASAGAARLVPVARVSNISQTIETLKRKNIWISNLDSNGDNIYSANMTGAIAIVVGNEADGVSRLVRSRSDFSVCIPMMGQISSLNASVAAAVAMYEVLRQRG